MLKISNKDKNAKKACTDEGCMVGNKGLSCRTNEVVYQITCKECNDIYIGETSRNAHTRSKEHAEDLRRMLEGSVLRKHELMKHGGQHVEFEMEVLSSFQHDPLARQCAEANWINKIK